MMKKILILVLMCISLVTLAYDSCSCPNGDPGHVDHEQTKQVEFNHCMAKAQKLARRKNR